MASIRDFLVEAEFFEYSQQNYDLQRDIMSFILTEKYIENCKKAAELQEAGVTLTESYFIEALADDVAQGAANLANGALNTTMGKKAMQAYNDQQPKLLGKILEIIKVICRNILGFLNKFDEVAANVNAASSSLIGRLQQATFNQADVDKLYTILKNGKDVDYKSIITSSQPFESSLNLKFDTDVQKDEKLKTVLWLLSLVMSNTEVVLTKDWLSALRGKDIPDAVSQERLIPAIEDFITAKSTSQIAAVRSHLETSSIAKSKKITVKVDSETLKSNGAKIKELQPKVEAINAKEFENPSGAEFQQISDNIQYIKLCVTNTIHMYDLYTTYRKAMITALTSFVNEHAKITPKQKEGE